MLLPSTAAVAAGAPATTPEATNANWLQAIGSLMTRIGMATLNTGAWMVTREMPSDGTLLTSEVGGVPVGSIEPLAVTPMKVHPTPGQPMVEASLLMGLVSGSTGSAVATLLAVTVHNPDGTRRTHYTPTEVGPASGAAPWYSPAWHQPFRELRLSTPHSIVRGSPDFALLVDQYRAPKPQNCEELTAGSAERCFCIAQEKFRLCQNGVADDAKACFGVISAGLLLSLLACIPTAGVSCLVVISVGVLGVFYCGYELVSGMRKCERDYLLDLQDCGVSTGLRV